MLNTYFSQYVDVKYRGNINRHMLKKNGIRNPGHISQYFKILIRIVSKRKTNKVITQMECYIVSNLFVMFMYMHFLYIFVSA